MIESIIQWSIKNRIFVLLATLVLVGLGIYSVKNTPVDAIPDLSDVQVIIKTNYPGQAPQVVEDQVTYPLATAMLAVPGAETVRAYSFFGDSYIYIIFKEGTDLYWARSRVLEYLNQVSSKLPTGAKPELGPDATGVGWIYEYALIDENQKHDLSQLTSIQNWLLKYELQTVPGVADVATVGGMVKQYQITLDPNRIRAYGLTIQRVKKAIQNANQEVGGSVIEMGEAEYMVRTQNGYIHNIDSIEKIPLVINKNGIPVLLSNVATISLGPKMRRGIAELDGRGETVGGIVIMRQGENALKTIAGVKQKISELKASLPTGVKIIETYDRSSLIKRAVNNLKQTLIEEMLIVILICLLFLFHFRSSLIVLISLPVGVLCSFIVMYYQGINANIMSLGGIAIAIGVMVDAAIVLIENVHKHIASAQDHNIERWQIIKTASQEVGPALFFSLLIITLSFLPVFTLQAQEGKLFAPLAYTKTYAMACSALLSITLVPVLMGLLIRGKVLTEDRNPINRFLISLYKPVINISLRAPITTLVVTGFIMMATLWPLGHIGSEFMPTLDEGDWMYMPTTLPGISIGKAQQLLQQTDKLIKSLPEVKSVFGKIGRANTATDPAPLTMIESVIQLEPKSKWRKGMTAEKLKAELNRIVKIPGVTNAWVMPIKTRIDMLATGIKTPIGIKISGPSLEKIQFLGREIEKSLKNVKGTASVFADRSAGGRYINIDINRSNAARFGLNIDLIQEVVRTAIGGMNITETVEGRERYPVNLRYPQNDRDSVWKIKQLPIVTPTGAHISLSDVANIYVSDGPPMIKSENARLTGWVLVDVDNIDVGTYIDQAKRMIATQVKIPAGYSLSWSGQYEYMQRAKARLSIVGPITLLIIFVLLYMSFRRLTEVLLILVTLPLSLVGGIWILYWLGYNYSVAVGVGFIALAGIAVEVGVVMLIYLNQALDQLRKANTKKITKIELQDAVMNGALRRIRPIVMTVASSVIGLLPVMLGRGTGSEVMRRIAAPMVGGMLSATLLTVLIIPICFYLLYKRKLIE